jgi:predicted nucleic acid-binding protein
MRTRPSGIFISDARLSRGASAFIETTIASGDRIGVSAISFAAMVYLIRRKRIPATALEDLLAAIGDPKNVLQQIAFDDVIAVNMRRVSRDEVPDLPDRIIAATAQFFGVPVLRRYGRIRAADIKTIW